MNKPALSPIACACILLPLVAALSFGGCSDSASSPLSPSAAPGSSALTSGSVAGIWRLAALQPAGRAEQATPGGATYSLTLADGRATLHVDCNVCSGAVTIGGQTLTLGPSLACTRAACATMEFESDYLPVVTGESSAQLSGSTLTLTSARGTVRFTR